MQHTVGSISADNAAHAHCRCAVKQTFGNQAVRLGNTRQAAGDGQNTVVDALDDLADSSADASLIAQISNVLASLAYDDTRLFRRDNGTQGELRLGVLLLSAWGHVALTIDGKTIELISDAAGILTGAWL
jgi:hypothetical protein